MQPSKRTTRRGFLLALLAAPAALVACTRSPEAAPVVHGSPEPERPPPRVEPTPAFTALHRVPLDRDVEPAFLDPAAAVSR